MPVLLALLGHPSLLGLPVGSPPWPSGRLSPGLWQRLLRGACLLPAASLGAFLLTVVPPAVHRVFPILCISFFSLKKKHFVYLFLESGKGGRKRGREIPVCGCLSPPTGDRACNPGMCPDWKSNQQPFGPQPVLNPLRYTSQGPLLIF